MSHKRDRFKERVINYHASGLRSAEIAEAIGVSASSVKRWLGEWGIQPHPGLRGRKADPIHADNIEGFTGTILGYHSVGYTSAEIACKLRDRIDLTPADVTKVLKEHGRTPQPA